MRQLATFLVIATMIFTATSARADDPKVDAAIAKEKAADEKDAKVHGKPDIMEWKWDTAVWTFVVFVLLFVILSKYAWGPILEGLKTREATITNVMEEAKRLRAENALDHANLKAELDAAYAKIPTMMEEARKDAAELKEQIRLESAAEIQKERQRLFRELDIAKDQALQELWTHSANLATLISSKVIGRNLGADDHVRLVDEALDELKQKVNN